MYTQAIGTKGSYQGRVFELVEISRLDGTLILKGRDATGRDVIVKDVRPEWFTKITEPATAPLPGSLPGVTADVVRAQMPLAKGPNEPHVDEPANEPVVNTSATVTPASQVEAAAKAATPAPAPEKL